ncbi:ABC transporter permease [Neorhizobium sp. NCHU2750]|uniref:ABC transporter permease n=1 Tax=Neorhizobium sp. NCHU2750 TaxID=1825976 RepID=UPI000E763F89|nr:spermidine/putrescine ABC transporter permease [Neorhizobium sp. NCHU2750]
MISSPPNTQGAWLWVGPAALLFLGVVMAPLVMTFLLTFYSWDGTAGIVPGFSFKNWVSVLSDSYYLDIFGRTFWYAAAATAMTLVIGLPEAIIVNQMSAKWRRFCLLVILGPLLVSVVARTLGWTLLFGGANGVVNKALMGLGLISGPIPFMFTPWGTIISLAHVLMPFMVLSVSAALQRLNPQIADAAASLGAAPWTVMRRVILPQIMPGILSGAIMVFAMAASSFATPAIIGGRRLKVVSTAIYDEFTNTLNWPLGAVIAVILLCALTAIIVGSNSLIEKRFPEAFR